MLSWDREPAASLVGARGWNADCGEPYQEQYEAPPGETGEKPKPAVENPGTDRPGGSLIGGTRDPG